MTPQQKKVKELREQWEKSKFIIEIDPLPIASINDESNQVSENIVNNDFFSNNLDEINLT
jgi:hypothetical protein